MGHVICPFAVAIVEMGRSERAYIMTLAPIVPADDFEKSGGQGKDLGPALEPEEVRGKDPIFAVGDFEAEMGGEPGGDRGHVWLPG